MSGQRGLGGPHGTSRMDATGLPVLGGRAPREAGETVPFMSGASDERLGRIDPGHASGTHRAACGGGCARTRARGRSRNPGRPEPLPRRASVRRAHRLASRGCRPCAGGLCTGRHLRQSPGVCPGGSPPGMVVGSGGSGGRSGYALVSRLELRLPRRQRRFHPTATGYAGVCAPLSQHLQLRPGRGPGAVARSPGRQIPGRDRRGLLWRHGGSGLRRALSGAGGPRDHHRRRGPQSSAGDRLAQRPAPHRGFCRRLRPATGGAEARASARHDDLPQSRGARSPLQRGRGPRRGALRVPHRGVPVRARQRVRAALPRGVLPVSVRVHRSAPGRCGTRVRSDHRGGHSRRPAGTARGPAGARRAAAARASARDFLHLRPRRLPQGVTAVARHISRGVPERPMSQTSDLITPLEAAANTSTSQVTQTVRAGIECGDATGCVVPPLHLSSTFAFRGFGDKGAYDYTRSGNPTRDLLAAALAELEQGAGAVVTASGMAAVTVVGYLVPAGGRIVAPHDCYGGTYRLFDAWRRRGERQVEFVDFGDAAAVRAALAQPTALLWIETPSNPLLRITDIAAFAALGTAAGALIVVDNTFLSPAWQQPLALGADLVVHSTTKYLNGHSDVVGGAVVARDKALHEQLAWWANCLGLTGAPFDSYMTLRGLRTLHARLDHHGRNAHALAHWLQEQVNVTRVWYPGLSTHPGHELAKR